MYLFHFYLKTLLHTQKEELKFEVSENSESRMQGEMSSVVGGEGGGGDGGGGGGAGVTQGASSTRAYI
jgi:uncharacterized membrane protein YgcG